MGINKKYIKVERVYIPCCDYELTIDCYFNGFCYKCGDTFFTFNLHNGIMYCSYLRFNDKRIFLDPDSCHYVLSDDNCSDALVSLDLNINDNPTCFDLYKIIKKYESNLEFT